MQDRDHLLWIAAIGNPNSYFNELLQGFHVAEVLIGLSVLLILIDYFFPTDFPAHFGYFCFGAGMFFVVPLGIFASTAVALGVWLLLAILHQFWFKRFLTNAPGTSETIEGTIRNSADSQPNADSQ